MNRIKLGIFIFFFLSTVWFSHFKKADYRTYRIHYSDFWRSVTGFLEVGVRNRFIVFWVDTVGFSTPLFFDGYKICILQLPQRVHRFLTPAFWWIQDLHIAAPAVCPLLFDGHSAAVRTPRWWGNTDKFCHNRRPIRFCGTNPFDAGSSHTTVWLRLTRSKNLVPQTENWAVV